MNLHQTAGCVLFNPAKTHVFLIHKDCLDEWLLPKGHIEKGETDQAAALRELGEETGFCDYFFVSKKPVSESIFEFNDNYGRRAKKKLIVFAVVLKSEKIVTDSSRKEGVAKGKWWTINQSLKTASYGNIKTAIQKAHEQIKSV